MNTVLRLKTVFLGAFLLLAFAYIGGLLIAAERQEDLKSTLEVQVSEQESLLSTIAETTARNGADVVGNHHLIVRIANVRYRCYRPTG